MSGCSWVHADPQQTVTAYAVLWIPWLLFPIMNIITSKPLLLGFLWEINIHLLSKIFFLIFLQPSHKNRVRDRRHYDLLFTNEEAEAPRRTVTWPRSHSPWLMKLELGFSEAGSGSCALHQYTMLPIFQELFFMMTNWVCSVQCLKHDLFTPK